MIESFIATVTILIQNFGVGFAALVVLSGGYYLLHRFTQSAPAGGTSREFVICKNSLIEGPVVIKAWGSPLLGVTPGGGEVRPRAGAGGGGAGVPHTEGRVANGILVMRVLSLVGPRVGDTPVSYAAFLYERSCEICESIEGASKEFVPFEALPPKTQALWIEAALARINKKA